MAILPARLQAFASPRRWPGAGRRWSAVFLFVSVYMLPNSAYAQYPCSYPGPGEIVVGKTPGNAHEPPLQLCQYVGGEDESHYDEPSSPHTQWGDSAMATAAHPDTSAVWATISHHTPESAKKRVMDACEEAMGEGCVYTESWTGDVFISVAMDGTGTPWLKGVPNSKAEAEKAAFELCEKEAGIWGCRIAYTIENGRIPAGADRSADYSEDFFPKAPVKRHKFAVMAVPDSTPADAWRKKSWLGSGRQSYEAAAGEVVDRCQADSGLSCSVAVGSSNGVLVHYADKHGQGFWTNALDAKSANARVNSFCQKDAAPCRILTVYDAATPRLQFVDEPALTRGYVSVAWPTTAGWPKLAIVTGRPSVAAADAEALALCESESKLTCALYLDYPDNKTSLVLGLFALSEDRLQIIFGLSVEEIEQRAAESCARNKVTCTQRAIVDLTQRSETTPAY
jgi:Domain of unknown function (DUF4189)